MLRVIIPHCKNTAPVIDCFQCSECAWIYVLLQPKPCTISYVDAERACWKFNEHRCEDFKLSDTKAA